MMEHAAQVELNLVSLPAAYLDCNKYLLWPLDCSTEIPGHSTPTACSERPLG